MNQTDFKKQQALYSQIIEDALNGFLQNPKFSGYESLLKAMRYAVLGGGKRLRGTLVLAFSKLFSDDYRLAIPAACAVEIFHAYTLIHDDLPCMDNDQLRRGKPSCWVNFGEAEALLAGDALLTFAFELLTVEQTGLCKRIQLDQIRTLATCGGWNGVVAGQIMDMDAEIKEKISYEELKQIHALKTGRLIEAAIRMGSVTSDVSSETLETTNEYAKHLGLQFQIVDDLLDAIGEEAILGKPVGSDFENHKTTYVSLWGIEETKRLAQLETQAALEALGKLPGETDFLKMLTKSMLNRVQ